MLLPLVKNSGLELDAVISVDELQDLQARAAGLCSWRSRSCICDHSKIGFVSSNCWDAIGAKSYGFNVYWINRAGAPVDRLGFKPDRILKSLDEILL